MASRPFALVPVADVERDGDAYRASSREPWLAVEGLDLRGLAGAHVTIAYRSSLWDAPARPLFRFLRGDTFLAEVIAPAPLEASALWTGRIPAGTTRVHVSPTTTPGRFAFRIESVRRRSWPALLAEGYRHAPRPARSAILTRLIGWRPESDNNLAWAIGAYPLETFATWSALRRRAVERDGLDRPRTAWDDASPLRVMVLAERRSASDLARTLGSLCGQLLPRWSAVVIGASVPAPSSEDPRVTFAVSISDAATGIVSDAAWFGVITAGTVLRPEALALVAERRARQPDATMVYGDECVGDMPILKPGWSPRLARALPFLGCAVFAKPSLFTRSEIESVLRGGDWPVPTSVAPLALRRILLARPEPPARKEPRPMAFAPSAEATEAAIVVLTRDQPALLARLVASIRARSKPGTYRLFVVDNGDAGGPAAAVLAELAAAPDAVVLSRPGPFNFSALCNEAAAASTEAVLVFLNDDMEVLSDGWLARLSARALEPDVGAVGARLTYPDGRLQHVGVLAGMGGSAGHFGAPAPGDDAGWAGRNEVLHEVSAATGACLAVARDKFEAVGGFDAAHLSVELSDIDLCFKLNQRGWQTLIDPAVHLMHEESFSRGGATFRRLEKYGDQRATFVARWRHVLRDDPVFHPALSLYSWCAALG